MRRQRPVAGRLAANFLRLIVIVGFCACSTTTNQGSAEQPSSSLQTLEYYSQLVKGYQNTYPARRVLVLTPIDARQFSDPTAAVHTPDNGNPAIGVVLNSDGAITQRLYSQPFLTLVQKAIEQSTEEAGMVALDSNANSYKGSREKGEDYVLEDKIVRCWVKKQRGHDGSHDPTWRTTAEFAIDVTIYKPPFRVAYWQGHSSAEFVDPPLTHAFGASDDDTAIYDDPGQVMSVALTRAVAGIFDRDDLRTLITEDRMVHSH
ncbi:MAG TPA: hypothetical protein VMB26_08685 [Candidatus Binataceae bacterium]|nr:hypothetical protein [Candidatus Binataceae bacterium]